MITSDQVVGGGLAKCRKGEGSAGGGPVGTVSLETQWRKYAKYIYVCQVQILVNIQSCDE